MGWDLNPIGLKHKVDTSSMESIAGFLVEHFNANVKCSRRNRGWHSGSNIPMTADCGTVICEGSSRTIELVEDRTGYMGSRDSWEMYFDWNPFPCYNDDDYAHIILFEDLVDLGLVECPFRWFGFLRNFVEHEADIESDTYCREALDRFRESISEYAKLFGCEKVMYIADQGPGEFILYQCEKNGADSMMGYTEGALDVPEFLSGGRTPIRQGQDVGYLDVLFDDFRDISGI